jgi:hypothetical protein
MSDFDAIFDEWLVDSVTVEAYEGAGVEGAIFGAATIVGGALSQIVGAEIMVEHKRRLIRNSDGNEVLSETTLYVSVAASTAFPLHSRVTLTDGTQTTVESVQRLEVYGLFDHAVVALA